MSDEPLQDGFSSVLAELERLVEFWGDLPENARKHGVRRRVIQRVRALMSPQMSTPYSMTIGALERLAAFRQRITHLNIRDKSFVGDLEALVITMIEQRAKSQLVRRDSFLLSNQVPCESCDTEVLEGWLAIRITLVASFGTCAAVVEQVDHVIRDMTVDFLDDWATDDAGIMVRLLELYEKLKAVPTLTTWIQTRLMWTTNRLRRPKCHPVSVDYDLPQIPKEQMPGHFPLEDIESSTTPADSAEYGRILEERDKQLTATIVSLEREVQALQLAKNDFESAVGTSNQQLDDLRLSHATLSSHKALLMQDLEDMRLLHMETCEKNNELEVQKATLSKRFALSKKSLQGTVHKLKDEIEVLQLTVTPKMAFIDSDREVYDMSFQSEGLKSKERLAEAEEDLTTSKKANDQLIAEQKCLQDSLATLLSEKAAGAEECENLNISNAALRDSIKLSHRMIDRLKSHCGELEEEANTHGKKKMELVSAKARLESSLSEAKDDHAALSESIKKLEADGANKEIELDQAAEIMSRLTDERERFKEDRDTSNEEKARLEKHLAEAVQALDQATSTITATNMHNLTAVNLRLEQELGAANEIIGQIKSTLLPRSTPTSIVQEASTTHDLPDIAAADLISFNEEFEWPSGASIDPWLMGDTESDAWSTMLTPPSGLDTDGSMLTLPSGLDTNEPMLSQRSGLDAWSTMLTQPSGLDANASMLTPTPSLDTNESMLTPQSGLDTNEPWYFGYTDPYDTLAM